MSQEKQTLQAAADNFSNLVGELSAILFDTVKINTEDVSLVKLDSQTLSKAESEFHQHKTVFFPSTSVNVKLPSDFKPVEYYEDLIHIPTKVPSIGEEEVEVPTTLEVYREDELQPHSLILSDRREALKMMDDLLAEIKALESELDEQLKTTDACPYQQSLNEFLGPNFVCPTIDDLPSPESFDAEASVRAIFEINERHHNLFLSQMEVMAKEAADTSFPGVTSQNLNNAFASLSTTANGQEFVFDRQKYARHLEFAEIVRNLNDEDIIKRPYEIIQKLVTRYIEIHQ